MITKLCRFTLQCSEKCLMLIDTCHHMSKRMSNITQIESYVLFMAVHPRGILGKLMIVVQNEARCLLSNLKPNLTSFKISHP